MSGAVAKGALSKRKRVAGHMAERDQGTKKGGRIEKTGGKRGEEKRLCRKRHKLTARKTEQYP